ncbi:hypothetical protein GCM10022224_014410 [Nonomuraea antimicrobica]|uniref:Uncharacterized protein n=1 Tax=Nonomuraea antimicrobica TaxID=561173 RepID=A0ABP7B9J8_9ACTN
MPVAAWAGVLVHSDMASARDEAASAVMVVRGVMVVRAVMVMWVLSVVVKLDRTAVDTTSYGYRELLIDYRMGKGVGGLGPLGVGEG